uniref:Uncharacterized protein n=1 Tax=Nymphaea colorata TaxID=210225 RepID=A0A5K0XW39_9MAGN
MFRHWTVRESLRGDRPLLKQKANLSLLADGFQSESTIEDRS